MVTAFLIQRGCRVNCPSCGASLQMGATHCYWCYEPVTPNPAQPLPLQQFPSSVVTPQSIRSQHIPPLPAAQAVGPVPRMSINNPLITRGDGVPAKGRPAAPLLFLSLLIVLSLVAVLVGGYYVHKEVNTFHSTATAFTQQLSNPTGQSISPSAASILSHAQLASAIDNALTPTHITSTFTTGQHIYLTFHIDSKGLDGAIQARWYADGQQVSRSMFHHAHENIVGLVSYVYTLPAKVGVVALFWCRQQNCSDAQLAVLVQFTVLIGNNPVVLASHVEVLGMHGQVQGAAPTIREIRMTSIVV